MKKPKYRAKESLESLNDILHPLWLIYTQLKDAEKDPDHRLEMLEHSREELARLLNEINRKPKSPLSQAANLNCRHRQKDLTPDTWISHVGFSEVKAVLEPIQLIKGVLLHLH